jgi:hypothetical protein
MPKCQKMVGCRNCNVAKAAEDMRIFRQAIVQFLITPETYIPNLKEMALSMKNVIDEWYEPHTNEYKNKGE